MYYYILRTYYVLLIIFEYFDQNPLHIELAQTQIKFGLHGEDDIWNLFEHFDNAQAH